MTPNERLIEIASILAAGVQRYFAHESKASSQPRNSQVGLEVVGEFEAPCGSRVQNPKSTRSKT
ncbi:MAG TPA: hypothetical protein VFZ65_01530 [Planctomycetota bacterium]|nr:hypothetical protein [Planctomycetota bacterium]